jgi:hypothetical protein
LTGFLSSGGFFLSQNASDLSMVTLTVFLKVVYGRLKADQIGVYSPAGLELVRLKT